jgi:hypothetical protein
MLILIIVIVLIGILYNEFYKVTTKMQGETKKLVVKINNGLINKKQIIYTKIIKKTKRALTKLGIPMFLSSGTCLGYFREGKFIDYDYDIDVGIFAKHYTPKLIKEMEKEGFVHYRTLGNRKTGLELSFRLPKTVLGKYAKIDIFLHYFELDAKTGKKYITWSTYAAPKFKKKVKYRVPSFKIKEVKFSGLNVYAPYPTLQYIENHYGKDWMIPKRPFTEYVYSKSPVSIVKI